MPESTASIAYMTKVGAGNIIAAPGRAQAKVTIWIRSSEPLPSRISIPAGTRIFCASSARSLLPVGSG
ncbi:hypothetical protein D3C83_54460 [compost metagenome]